MGIDFHKYRSLRDFQADFGTETACVNYLMRVRWPRYIESPFSAFGQVYECKNQKFRCRDTGRYFNVKTGTIFHGSKIPLQKWFCAMFLLYLTPGLSTQTLSETLGVPLKSSRKMLRVLKEIQSQIPARPHQSLTDWLQHFKA